MGLVQMRSPVSHSIQRPPFEALESGLPISDSTGTSIWPNGYKLLEFSHKEKVLGCFSSNCLNINRSLLSFNLYGNAHLSIMPPSTPQYSYPKITQGVKIICWHSNCY